MISKTVNRPETTASELKAGQVYTMHGLDGALRIHTHRVSRNLSGGFADDPGVYESVGLQTGVNYGQLFPHAEVFLVEGTFIEKALAR